MALMTTIDEVRALVEKHRREEETIRVEYERRIDHNRRVREAAEVTLQALLAETPLVATDDAPASPPPAEPEPAPAPVNWKRVLAGMTQPEALVRIAELGDGIVRTNDAKAIVIEAGLLRGNPKYLNSRLHTILIESDRFERIAPGTYRLLPGGEPGETTATIDSPGPSDG
jgi:hypothetical protein